MIEPELVSDWYARHRHKDPMHPKDPDDVCLGWTYAISSHWRQSKSALTEWEILQGKTPKEEFDVVDYASTLGDARLMLELQVASCEQRNACYYRRMSANRFYSSDGEHMHTLCIIPVLDEDPENIS